MMTKEGWTCLLLLVLAGMPQLRGELKEAVYSHGDYNLRVSVERIDVLVKSADEVLNFPGLTVTGKLILLYGRGRHGQEEGRLSAISTHARPVD